jgi:acyl carrier protein
LNLVFALEGEFAIQFEAEEIPDLITYRAIRERITEAESLG